jgi:hypothetical protein
MSAERRLVHIVRVHAHLMISTAQIELGEEHDGNQRKSATTRAPGKRRLKC